MKKATYILCILVLLCACGENENSNEMESTHTKLPDCSAEMVRGLKNSETEISEYIELVKAAYTTCRVSSEVWKSILEDSTFSDEHRANAFFGLLLTQFKPGMTLNSFLGLMDKNGAYGVKGNFRLCRNPLFFENRKPDDLFVMCNPLGSICLKDTLGVETCYAFTLHLSCRSGRWSSHINEDDPQAHQKIMVDGIQLSGKDWDVLIEKGSD